MVVLGLGVSGPVLAQTAMVNGALVLAESTEAQGSLPDYSGAVVWLEPTGDGNGRVGPTPGHFEILQEDKHFLPRVLPMPVGSSVDFPNLDPFFHNVFSLFEGKRFDLGLYEAGASRSTLFDRPGVSYIFCNIHPEMIAVVVAVPSDLFTQTDTEGRYSIGDVPPGTYTLRVWHERMETRAGTTAVETVSVGRSDVEVSPVAMEATDLALESHTNKFGLEYESPATTGAPYLLPR